MHEFKPGDVVRWWYFNVDQTCLILRKVDCRFQYLVLPSGSLRCELKYLYPADWIKVDL